MELIIVMVTRYILHLQNIEEIGIHKEISFKHLSEGLEYKIVRADHQINSYQGECTVEETLHCERRELMSFLRLLV